jgi:hypothetical protein
MLAHPDWCSEAFLIKYLSIPLSTSKLSKAALQPLVEKVADNLPIWKGRLLQRSGRLAIIKSTFMAILAYLSISIGLPPWLYKALKKIMVAFLWTGSDMVQRGKCLVAWDHIQRPLHLGGLGVLDLWLFGIALRVRWLWLRRADMSHPWVALSGKEDR